MSNKKPPAGSTDSRYLTIPETMHALDCTEVWVHVLKRDGTLRSKVTEIAGRARRVILRSDVDKYLKRRKAKGGAK